MAKQNKTLIEKVADKVDHLLHPEAPFSNDAPESAVSKDDKKSVEKTGLKPEALKKLRAKNERDLQKHPKFAKFN